MKVVSKIFCILILLILFKSSIPVGAEPTTLGTIKYLDEGTFLIDGNVTLFFIESDSGNNDIELLWRMFDASTNKTIYHVRSKEVVVDEFFVNNTKAYHYTGDYIIFIDYSDIIVPPSCSELLAEKDAQILALTNTLEERDEQIRSLQVQLNETLLLFQDMKLNLTSMTSKVDQLRGEIDEYEEKETNASILYKTLQDKYNADTGIWAFSFNAPTLICTIILIALAMYFLNVKKSGGAFMFERFIKPKRGYMDKSYLNKKIDLNEKFLGEKDNGNKS